MSNGESSRWWPYIKGLAKLASVSDAELFRMLNSIGSQNKASRSTDWSRDG